MAFEASVLRRAPGVAAESLDRIFEPFVRLSPERGETGVGGGIGRGEDVGFRIDGTSISRRHCQLQVMGGQLTVVDLGSTNGTFIGRDKISGMMVIPNGAKLVVGNHVLRHERRSRKEASRSMELETDMRKAGAGLARRGEQWGGLGIQMIRRVVEAMDYQRLDGRNRLRLSVPINDHSAGDSAR